MFSVGGALDMARYVTGTGKSYDFGTRVGRNDGFWNQPGVLKNRRWGPSGPAYQEQQAGGPGLQAFTKGAGGGGGGGLPGLPSAEAQQRDVPQGPTSGLAQALQARLDKAESEGEDKAARRVQQRQQSPARPLTGLRTESGGPTMAPSLASPVQTLTRMVGAY